MNKKSLSPTQDYAVERNSAGELFEALFNSLQIGAYIVQDGKFVAVNPQFRKDTGFTEEELLGTTSLSQVHPEDRETARVEAIKRLKGELTSPYEFRIIVKGGETRVTMETVTTIQYEGRRAVLGYHMDITERKRIEEALKESEAHYRELAESITDVFFAVDEDLRCIYWNQASEKLTGIPAKDALGKHLYDIFPDSEQTRGAEEVYKKVLKTKQPQHFVNEYQLNGKDYFLETSAYPVKSGLTVFVRDVTERKRIESRWLDSMSNFYKVVNNNADSIIITDSEGKVLFVNPAAELLLGRKRGDFQGQQFGFPITPGDTTEIDITRHTSETVVAEMRVVDTVWFDEIAYLVTLRDVTERKRMEEALRESKEFNSSLMENAPNPVLVANPDTSIRYVNPALEKLTGFTSEEVSGKKIPYPWWLEDEVPKGDTEFVEHMHAGVRGLETHFWKKNGGQFWVELTSAPVIRGGRFQYSLENWLDITERKQAQLAQERLSQQLQEKVSELETFSYGIAHDLRSPLVSIEGFSRLLRDDMLNQDKEKVQEDMRLIDSGVRKMQNFLNRTLEYSHAGQLVKRTENISFGKIAKEVITEFNGQISSIGATVSLADKYPRVYADRMRITQVLANLIQNSIKYRDKTVPLKIEIGHRLSKGETIFFVRDNGLGMDASEAEKAFALFYRGTADGQGSGIGLAIVRKIIEAHGGRIWVQRGQSGKGTTMCFTLPQPRGINKGDNNGKD